MKYYKIISRNALSESVTVMSSTGEIEHLDEGFFKDNFIKMKDAVKGFFDIALDKAGKVVNYLNGKVLEGVNSIYNCIQNADMCGGIGFAVDDETEGKCAENGLTHNGLDMTSYAEDDEKSSRDFSVLIGKYAEKIISLYKDEYKDVYDIDKALVDAVGEGFHTVFNRDAVLNEASDDSNRKWPAFSRPENRDYNEVTGFLELREKVGALIRHALLREPTGLPLGSGMIAPVILGSPGIGKSCVVRDIYKVFLDSPVVAKLNRRIDAGEVKGTKIPVGKNALVKGVIGIDCSLLALDDMGMYIIGKDKCGNEIPKKYCVDLWPVYSTYDTMSKLDEDGKVVHPSKNDVNADSLDDDHIAKMRDLDRDIQPTILFLDEITRLNPVVANGLHLLISEHSVGSNARLGTRVVIVGAGNYSSEASSGLRGYISPFDGTALNSRLRPIFYYVPLYSDWRKWAVSKNEDGEQNIEQFIVDFLDEMEMLSKNRKVDHNVAWYDDITAGGNGEMKGMNPRLWEVVSRMYVSLITYAEEMIGSDTYTEDNYRTKGFQNFRDELRGVAAPYKGDDSNYEGLAGIDAFESFLLRSDIWTMRDASDVWTGNVSVADSIRKFNTGVKSAVDNYDVKRDVVIIMCNRHMADTFAATIPDPFDKSVMNLFKPGTVTRASADKNNRYSSYVFSAGNILNTDFERRMLDVLSVFKNALGNSAYSAIELFGEFIDEKYKCKNLLKQIVESSSKLSTFCTNNNIVFRADLDAK